MRIRSSCVAAAVVALTSIFVAAPAHAASDKNRYTLVGGCFALHSDATGSYVAQGGGGYNANAGNPGAGEGFRMQATELGTYLLFGEDEDFLDGAGGSVSAASDPSPSAEWKVRESGQSFTLENRETGQKLGTDGSGNLITNGGGSFGFSKTTGCAVYPEIEVNVDGEPKGVKYPYSEVKGYAETHMHGMAFEFLSGEAHCGRPWHRYGAPYALDDCFDHKASDGCGAILETAVGGDTCHGADGWPSFNSWPKHYSLTHEGMYYRWLERAYKAGLRVFVNLYVENRVLCELYPEGADPNRTKNSCNEMDSVLLQSKRMHELQDYIDAQEGGPGKGWFRIVTDPFEAREVIADGKLAVVPGMEVSEPFDCTIQDGVPECDGADIKRWLDILHDEHGVSQLEIINKFDNALSGVAGDGGSTGVLTNSGNKSATGRYWDLETCEDPENTDHSPTSVQHNDDEAIANGLAALLPPGAAPVYPPEPHCNKYGLSALGEFAVRQIAKRGMIFDPDHMSVYGRNASLNVIDAVKHPGLMTSHSWSTPNTLPRVAKVGGMVGPYAGSAEGFVNKWKEAKAVKRGKQYWGLGYGADMNGLGGQGRPRGTDVPNPVTYPFKSFVDGLTVRQQVSGTHVYDFNAEGVAHYGMYADWWEDLRKITGNDRIVKDLARGAEAYLQMWERSDGIEGVKCDVWHGDFQSDRGLDRQLKIGQLPEGVLKSAGQPVDRQRAWKWCTRTKKDHGKRQVIGVFDKKPRLAMIASTLSRHSAGGVSRGDKKRKAARRGKQLAPGIYVRDTGKRAFIYGVRKDRVRWVAIAKDDVVKSRKTVEKYAKLAGLK